MKQVNEANEINLEDLEAAADFYDRLIDLEADEEQEVQKINESNYGRDITRYMIEKNNSF